MKKIQIYTVDSHYSVIIAVRRCVMSKLLIVEDDLSIQALLHRVAKPLLANL